MAIQNFAWQLRERLSAIGKQRGKITIPAFSAVCGGPRSFSVTSGDNQLALTESGLDFTGNFTFKFWVNFNTMPAPGNGLYYRIIQNEAGQFGHTDLGVYIVDSCLAVSVAPDTGGTTVQSTTILSPNKWYYVVITRNSTTGVVNIYLGGMLDTTATTIIGAIGSGVGNFTIAGSSSIDTFYLSSLEMYDRILTAGEMDFYQYSMAHSALNGLKIQFYFSENNALGYYINNVTGTHFVPVNGVSEGLFPHSNLYGASFIAALFEATTSFSCALKVPINRPTNDVNFVLAISYVNSDSEIIRYYCWVVDGITIPNATLYTGQQLSKNFTLEIWNKDGNATVDLASDLTLYTSSRRVVTELDYNTINSDTTIAIDTIIGTTYPLTDPMIFNTQPVY